MVQSILFVQYLDGRPRLTMNDIGKRAEATQPTRFESSVADSPWTSFVSKFINLCLRLSTVQLPPTYIDKIMMIRTTTKLTFNRSISVSYQLLNRGRLIAVDSLVRIINLVRNTLRGHVIRNKFVWRLCYRLGTDTGVYLRYHSTQNNILLFD